MQVRAKFKVTTNEGTPEGGHVVKLWPVVGGSKENEEFYKYTPGGEISLSTINHEAAKQFVIGNEFYVDFSAA